jgi:hypothetical protein
MAELTGAPVAASPRESPRGAVPTAGSRSTAWTLVHTAALSAAAVGLLLLGVLTGRYVLAVLLIPLQVLLLLAWLAALNASGLLWSAVVVSGSAVAADLLTATGPLGVRRLAGVVAVSLLIAMLAQLVRRDGRVNLTTSLAATLGAVVLVAGLAVLVALRRTVAGHDAAMTALIGTGGALVVARGFDALRLLRSATVTRRRSVTGLVLAGAVAVALGWLLGAVRSSLGIGDGIALATASAVVALAADIGLDIARAGQPPDPSADRARAALLPLSVLLPVCLAAPSAYVAGRVLLG